jgi:hypothetical protein
VPATPLSLRRSPVSTVPRLPLQAPASADLASVQTSDASYSPTARTVVVASWGSPAAQHPSGRTTGYTSPCAAPAHRAPTSTRAAPWAASPVPPHALATSPMPRSTPYSRRATRRRGIQLQPQRLLLHGRPQLQLRRVRHVRRHPHQHQRHAAHVELRGRPAQAQVPAPRGECGARRGRQLPGAEPGGGRGAQGRQEGGDERECQGRGPPHVRLELQRVTRIGRLRWRRRTTTTTLRPPSLPAKVAVFPAAVGSECFSSRATLYSLGSRSFHCLSNPSGRRSQGQGRLRGARRAQLQEQVLILRKLGRLA